MATRLDIESFSLALARPLETAAGTIERRRGFRIGVSVDGTSGVGEATPLSGWTESYTACESALRSIDAPASALEGDRLADTPAARHGVSLAVLDARSRAAGVPLYQHLGREECVTSVPVNATIGSIPPAETAAAAQAAVRAGYSTVKIKVGREPSDVDSDRLEAVRSRCPDVDIRVDANGAWDEDTAISMLPTLAGLGVTVVEQPLSADDLTAHARLRGRGVEIALDEGLIEHGPSAALDADAADILVCKPMALGGIDIARNVILAARDRGVDGLVTTTIDGSIARAAAIHLAGSIPDMRPCGLATGDLIERDRTDPVGQIIDGMAVVPQGKGNIPRR